MPNLGGGYLLGISREQGTVLYRGSITPSMDSPPCSSYMPRCWIEAEVVVEERLWGNLAPYQQLSTLNPKL